MQQINPLKNNSYIVYQKISNNLNGNQNKNKIKKKNQDSNARIKHASISGKYNSNDLSSNFGMENLTQVNSNIEEMNYGSNSILSKNHFIKVNTKRNKNLSLINQSRTIKMSSEFKNLEETGLFAGISEINIFKNNDSKNKKLIFEPKKLYDINKVIYIQKWWKEFLLKNKEKYAFLYLNLCIKKIILLKVFISLKNIFPPVNYFLHKWNDKVNKLNIFHQLIINKSKLKKNKLNKKNKLMINTKIEPKCLKKRIKSKGDSVKNSKDKYNKSNKLINNKTKFISINTNTETSKNKEKNSYCRTTKNNKKLNYINYTLNNNNNNNTKKSMPCSPIDNSKIERHISPLNILQKKINIMKASISKDKKKYESNTIKKNNKRNKKNEDMSNRVKSKTLMNKIGNGKCMDKIDNLNLYNRNSNYISSSKRKSEVQPNYDNCSLVLQEDSQFSKYILNINKKDIVITHRCHNYSKGDKKERLFSEECSLYKYCKTNKNNSKSHYFNTDSNNCKIDSLFSNKVNKFSNVNDNCLYKVNKNQNYCYNENNDLNKQNQYNYNNNIIVNKHNNIPINKKRNAHRKNKGKFDLKNNKNNNNYQAECLTVNENNSTISKVSKRENSSYEKVKNIKVNKYFYYWKKSIDKKNILNKLSKITKFLKHLNRYLLQNSMKILIRSYAKDKFYKCIKWLIIKQIIKVIMRIDEYKKKNLKEIKIVKKNKYNNILFNFNREKGNRDIINNIKINSYIYYDDTKLFKKRKARSPNLLSRISESKTFNNNSQLDYFETRLTLSNSISDKLININKKGIKNNDEEITSKIYTKDESEKNYSKKYYNDNSGFLSHKMINDFNGEKLESGVIVDQINQLKMVFNLLEQQKSKNKKEKSYTLLDYFKKWKLFSLNYKKNKSVDMKLNTPKISEKIINLKPFQASKIIKNSMSDNPINLSLNKNFGLNKMSPKIINVINVQNFNENNNYNYNFKYMPIKDIPIYPQKPRNTCSYNNIDKLNSDLNNLTNCENTNNAGEKNNVELNSTSFLIPNENRHINQKIIYHKKKLNQNFISNNNFELNNNIYKISNNSDVNNYYKNNPKNSYKSQLFFLDNNQAQILMPEFNNRIYNFENNGDMRLGKPFYREKSFNNKYSCIYKTQLENIPENKYIFDFKNIRPIEEKEINFMENGNNPRNNIYIKKQHYEYNPKNLGNDYNIQNNIKTNLFGNDENEKKDNLIKCLNIQFGKTNKVLANNDKNNNEDSNKCITISEDNSVKSKIMENRGKISLRKKNCKRKLDDEIIKTENKEEINKTINLMNEFNKIKIENENNENNNNLNNNICDMPLKKRRQNQTFVIYSNTKEDF